MKYMTIGAVAAVLTLGRMAVAADGVLFVDDDAAPAGDGQSWDTAYRFLQDAITFAADPVNGVTEIRVAQGVYQPDRDEDNPDGAGDREATFQLVNGVALMGGYAGIGAEDPDARDIDLYEAVLSGDLLGNDESDFLNNEENCFHVVAAFAVNESAVIDGFTITAGNANGFDDQLREDQRRGGGMYNSEAHPTVNRCAFVENAASRYGGGMANERESNPNVSQCTFIGNVATGEVGGFGSGGGMFNGEGSPCVMACTFFGNSAVKRGGGMYNTSQACPTLIGCVFSDNIAHRGGGVFNSRNIPIVTHCYFSQNLTHGSGGGMYNDDVCCGAIVANTSFVSNISLGQGGGMVNNDGDARITNCLFVGNSAARHGGAIYNRFWSSLEIANTTIVGNHSDAPGGGIYTTDAVGQSEIMVINTIVWGNDPPEIADVAGATTTVHHSDVKGGWPGPGNIDADPMFVDRANGDYRLLPGSPCIDAGDNGDIGLCELDLDGRFRRFDDRKTRDTGLGAPPIVDMGAYEFGGPLGVDCNMNALDDLCELADGITPDCNRNGIPDDCDIADGFSLDCNGNGVPDECDAFDDCNGNGVPDECEVDCNGNGVPDDCEAFDDCNANGIPDECDIAAGQSEDCNGNGIPDECERGDCNENGIPDECEVDCNRNGIPDDCDIADGTSTDCNENGIPDECETDCNTNGVPDDCDIANGSFDCDQDGVPDECQGVIGDLSDDGVVDTTDLLLLLGNWGRCDLCDDCYADIDCDCSVGTFDLIILLGNWG